MALLAGIFVGGKSSRMGGRPKGLLLAPDTGETLVERTARIIAASLPGTAISLVGESAAYQALPFPVLADDPPGTGPLGGLIALLKEGAVTSRQVIAVACDLPFIDEMLVNALAHTATEAAAVAPFVDQRWLPVFARYAPDRVLSVAVALERKKRRSLQGIFRELGQDAVALEVSAQQAELLRDWDAPGDIHQ